MEWKGTFGAGKALAGLAFPGMSWPRQAPGIWFDILQSPGLRHKKARELILLRAVCLAWLEVPEPFTESSFFSEMVIEFNQFSGFCLTDVQQNQVDKNISGL